jgi:hypothetical protein
VTAVISTAAVYFLQLRRKQSPEVADVIELFRKKMQMKKKGLGALAR